MGSGFSGELFLLTEATHVSNDVLGELTDEGIVGSNGLVKSTSFHSDSIFCSLQLILQSQEILVHQHKVFMCNFTSKCVS